jgi:hypothetical protein
VLDAFWSDRCGASGSVIRGAIDARRFRVPDPIGVAPPHVEDMGDAAAVGQAVLRVGVRSGGARRSPGTRIAAIVTRRS